MSGNLKYYRDLFRLISKLICHCQKFYILLPRTVKFNLSISISLTNFMRNIVDKNYSKRVFGSKSLHDFNCDFSTNVLWHGIYIFAFCISKSFNFFALYKLFNLSCTLIVAHDEACNSETCNHAIIPQLICQFPNEKVNFHNFYLIFIGTSRPSYFNFMSVLEVGI